MLAACPRPPGHPEIFNWGSQKVVVAFILLPHGLGWAGQHLAFFFFFFQIPNYYRDFNLSTEVPPIHWDFTIL